MKLLFIKYILIGINMNVIYNYNDSPLNVTIFMMMKVPTKSKISCILCVDLLEGLLSVYKLLICAIALAREKSFDNKTIANYLNWMHKKLLPVIC
jgi:hypothetical protein